MRLLVFVVLVGVVACGGDNILSPSCPPPLIVERGACVFRIPHVDSLGETYYYPPIDVPCEAPGFKDSVAAAGWWSQARTDTISACQHEPPSVLIKP